ncbi:MAG TPA: MarR family transcriptional regulator [Streptomyces sp.]
MRGSEGLDMRDTDRPGRAGSDSLDPLEATGHLLRRANQRFVALWSGAMPGGLTAPQLAVLALLAVEQPLDQQTIGERGGFDKSTCGYLIDRMDRAGLVQAAVDPDNRRRKLVHLTPEGRSALDEALPVKSQVEEALTASLTPSERTELDRLLTKMLTLQGDGSVPGELEGR